jgi:anti-sigma regulatory factor (Ser/Thr protein kinase)
VTGTAHRRSLPATPASAGEARRFVASVLVGDLAPLAPLATLLVSELVANAVLHTGTPVDVSVAVDGSRARVEVHDGSRQLPVRKNYSTLSGTGRGLVMVDRMAARWGAEADATGKVVWFELDPKSAPVLDFLEADAR